MAAYTFRIDHMSMRFPKLNFETHAKSFINDWQNNNRERLNEKRKLQSQSGL